MKKILLFFSSTNQKWRGKKARSLIGCFSRPGTTFGSPLALPRAQKYARSAVLPTLQIFLKMADFQFSLQMKFSQKSAKIFGPNGRFFLLTKNDRFLYKLCKFWQILYDKSFIFFLH